jgi:hypothetical protein
MDDFVISNLHEAKNEWAARLVGVLTPLVIDGIRSIFNEAWSMCVTNNEISKYLMTMQNLLTSVSKWNANTIENERKRIIEKSGCTYLEDLIMCVHIIQLKVLTSIRVGNRQKKIDLSIPKLDAFIHKVYINVARKCYSNIYLFEKNISPLQVQKNSRELELIVQESVLTTIRESIPTETIIRAYLDESVEHEEEVTIEQLDPIVKNEPVNTLNNTNNNSMNGDSDESDMSTKMASIPENPDDNIPEIIPTIRNVNDDEVVTKLSFNDMDMVLDGTDSVKEVEAPKTLDRLEKISMERSIQRKLEEEEDDDDDKIHIHTEPFDISGLDILDIDGGLREASNNVSMDVPSLDFELLE